MRARLVAAHRDISFTEDIEMADYVLYADSACDLDQKYFEEWNVKRIDLHFWFVDEGI